MRLKIYADCSKGRRIVHVFTIEIPEDNGSNYLEWNGQVQLAYIAPIAGKLTVEGWKHKETDVLIRLEKEEHSNPLAELIS